MRLTRNVIILYSAKFLCRNVHICVWISHYHFIFRIKGWWDCKVGRRVNGVRTFVHCQTFAEKEFVCNFFKKYNFLAGASAQIFIFACFLLENNFCGMKKCLSGGSFCPNFHFWLQSINLCCTALVHYSLPTCNISLLFYFTKEGGASYIGIRSSASFFSMCLHSSFSSFHSLAQHAAHPSRRKLQLVAAPSKCALLF